METTLLAGTYDCYSHALLKSASLLLCNNSIWSSSSCHWPSVCHAMGDDIFLHLTTTVLCMQVNNNNNNNNQVLNINCKLLKAV